MKGLVYYDVTVNTDMNQIEIVEKIYESNIKLHNADRFLAKITLDFYTETENEERTLDCCTRSVRMYSSENSSMNILREKYVKYANRSLVYKNTNTVSWIDNPRIFIARKSEYNL